MPRLVVIEGPDKLGKSLVSKYIAEKLGWVYHCQPTGIGIVGYIRNIVKDKNIEFNGEIRQMFHVISHIVDAFTIFNGNNILLDRSYISNLVYSNIMGISPILIQHFYNIQRDIYIKQLKDYEVEIILLDKNKPFLIPEEDSDFYETNYSWINIRDMYTLVLNSPRPFFSNNEKIIKIEVENGKRIMCASLLNRIYKQDYSNCDII